MVEDSETQDTSLNKNTVTLKKSSYNGMIITVIIAIGVSTFLTGWIFASSYEKEADVEDSLKAINSKLDKLDEKISTSTANTQASNQPKRPTNISTDDDPVIGDQDAAITIVEFSDFQCPFCAKFYKDTLPLIEQNYINQGIVKFVYRDFPIDNIHSNARAAHIAAECADSQGAFWKYHDMLFEKQSEWADSKVDRILETFTDYADTVGIDRQTFRDCLRSPAVASEVQEDLVAGRGYDVTGTPTFFVGNQETGFVKISGAKPFSAFAEIIESKLN